eukprot:ANDGO_02411.mRNA.1 Ubiquitin-like protein SMT3
MSEDIKPNVKPESTGEKIRITLRSNDQNVEFVVKPTTPFEKVFEKFGERTNMSNFRVVFDGERVLGNQCPADIGIAEGDVLDVFVEQTGGQ